MSQQVILKGMVLSAMSIGDYDKRITILTSERGKITAFARGAKRPNSQLLAATSPFTFGEFELFEGKTAYNLAKATIHNYFRELLSDLDATYYGFYFMEFADYYCQENSDEKEMLKLLYQSLRALESPSFDNELVRVIFELRAITINGEGPDMFSCIHCHKSENLAVFSVERGGMFCEQCAKNIHGQVIHESTRYAFQYIIATPIEKLFTFSVTDEVLKEMKTLMKKYVKQYVNHKFKSLDVLEQEAEFHL